MTSRELPPAEWSRLAETTLGPSLAVLNPAWSKIVVVEDGADIIGAWTAVATFHAEGAWIAPNHQKRGGVARCLRRALKASLAPWSVSAVIVSPSTEAVRALLQRHATPLPAEEYLLWLQ